MENDKKVKLSKSVLEMKFMKKTKEKVQKDEEDAEGQAMYSKEITEEMKRDGNIIFREASISLCKNLVDGRLSFGGMNPEIENFMKSDYNKALATVEKKREKDISDEQMASIIHTVQHKFKTKNQKRKFQKPSSTEPLV